MLFYHRSMYIRLKLTTSNYTIDSAVFIINVYLKQTEVKKKTQETQQTTEKCWYLLFMHTWHCSIIDQQIDLELMGHNEEQALCLQHANQCSRTVIKDRQSQQPASFT